MNNKKETIMIMVMIFLATIIVRVYCFPLLSGDYVNFLEPWVEEIREKGGFAALKEPLGNYNIPYIIILILISYLKCEPLIPIKIVSIIFDFICAFATYKIVNKITNNKNTAMAFSVLVLWLPTVIMNGALWGQCDSIYGAFVLLAIYYLMENKNIKAFVMLGLAFAFKLQAVFILPLFVLLLFRNKDIKWYYFFIPVGIVLLAGMPAIIAGQSISSVLGIYGGQVETYNALTANFPNIYSIIIKFPFAEEYNSLITIIGILVTMLVYFAIWLVVLIKKINFDEKKILLVGLWSIIIATFLLPRMHDRYMYIADILSVIWLVVNNKNKLLPLMINLTSTITYLGFLFFGEGDYSAWAVIYTLTVIEFTVYVFRVLLGKKKLDEVVEK